MTTPEIHNDAATEDAALDAIPEQAQAQEVEELDEAVGGAGAPPTGTTVVTDPTAPLAGGPTVPAGTTTTSSSGMTGAEKGGIAAAVIGGTLLLGGAAYKGYNTYQYVKQANAAIAGLKTTAANHQAWTYQGGSPGTGAGYRSKLNGDGSTVHQQFENGKIVYQNIQNADGSWSAWVANAAGVIEQWTGTDPEADPTSTGTTTRQRGTFQDDPMFPNWKTDLNPSSLGSGRIATLPSGIKIELWPDPSESHGSGTGRVGTLPDGTKVEQWVSSVTGRPTPVLQKVTLPDGTVITTTTDDFTGLLKTITTNPDGSTSSGTRTYRKFGAYIDDPRDSGQTPWEKTPTFEQLMALIADRDKVGIANNAAFWRQASDGVASSTGRSADGEGQSLERAANMVSDYLSSIGKQVPADFDLKTFTAALINSVANDPQLIRNIEEEAKQGILGRSFHEKSFLGSQVDGNGPTKSILLKFGDDNEGSFILDLGRDDTDPSRLVNNPDNLKHLASFVLNNDSSMRDPSVGGPTLVPAPKSLGASFLALFNGKKTMPADGALIKRLPKNWLANTVGSSGLDRPTKAQLISFLGNRAADYYRGKDPNFKDASAAEGRALEKTGFQFKDSGTLGRNLAEDFLAQNPDFTLAPSFDDLDAILTGIAKDALVKPGVSWFDVIKGAHTGNAPVTGSDYTKRFVTGGQYYTQWPGTLFAKDRNFSADKMSSHVGKQFKGQTWTDDSNYFDQFSLYLMAKYDPKIAKSIRASILTDAKDGDGNASRNPSILLEDYEEGDVDNAITDFRAARGSSVRSNGSVVGSFKNFLSFVGNKVGSFTSGPRSTRPATGSASGTKPSIIGDYPQYVGRLTTDQRSEIE